ncbi:MAG TPA: VWA domain-containing protein [Kofleriaceae bacterium]|nr:VWA domain-containing protein [Kofleriaceae bacterium]
MSLLGPIPMNVLLYFGAGAALLAVTAYIIKMRRRRFEVPFSALWRRVIDQRDPNSLWKHLKRLLSLLFILLILAIVLFAAAGPMWGVSDHDAKNVVILLDASASMKAKDGDKDGTRTRFDDAKKKAEDLIDSMGGGDTAMVMRMDGQTTPLGRFSSDGPMLKKLVEGVLPTDTPADLHRALGAAADALRDRKNPLIVIISDGAFPADQIAQARWIAPKPGAPEDLASIDLTGMDVRYIPVGSRSDNVGIVAFNVRRYVDNKAAYEVFIEVENFGTEKTERRISLFDGELEIFPDENHPFELAPAGEPGARVRKIYKELPTGATGRLRAQLSVPKGLAPDPFPLDDEAYALLPTRKMMHVLMVMKHEDIPLRAALLTYDNIDPEEATPQEYEADHTTAWKHDAIVFDDWAPAEPPPVNAIYFHPDADKSPVAIKKDLKDPHVTEIDEAHPVMRWIGLSDTHFDESHVFAPDKGKNEQALASMAGDPILVAKRDQGHKYLVFGFSLTGSDIYLRVAFPLLMVNALDWFAGDDADLLTTYATGVRQRVVLDGGANVREAELVAPDGKTKVMTPVVDGLATFYADRVGVWRVAGKLPDGHTLPPIDLAANLANPIESKIAPAKNLVLGGQKLREPEPFAMTRNQELWIYFLIAAVALLSIEWITYHRRITV